MSNKEKTELLWIEGHEFSDWKVSTAYIVMKEKKITLVTLFWNFQKWKKDSKTLLREGKPIITTTDHIQTGVRRASSRLASSCIGSWENSPTWHSEAPLSYSPSVRVNNDICKQILMKFSSTYFSQKSTKGYTPPKWVTKKEKTWDEATGASTQGRGTRNSQDVTRGMSKGSISSPRE